MHAGKNIFFKTKIILFLKTLLFFVPIKIKDFPELLLHDALKLQLLPLERKNKFDLLLFKSISKMKFGPCGVCLF